MTREGGRAGRLEGGLRDLVGYPEPSGPGALEAIFRSQGFLPAGRFRRQLGAGRAGLGGVARRFTRLFLRSPHYRAPGAGSELRLMIRGPVAVVYRSGGPGGSSIVLLGCLPRCRVPFGVRPTPAPERETAAEPDGTIIPLWRLLTRPITAPREGTSYRGVTEAHRRWAQATYEKYLREVNLRRRAQGLPLLAKTPVHVGHVTPHVFARPGERILVRPEEATVNLADAPGIRAAAKARRALGSPGLFTRGLRPRAAAKKR